MHRDLLAAVGDHSIHLGSRAFVGIDRLIDIKGDSTRGLAKESCAHLLCRLVDGSPALRADSRPRRRAQPREQVPVVPAAMCQVRHHHLGLVGQVAQHAMPCSGKVLHHAVNRCDKCMCRAASLWQSYIPLQPVQLSTGLPRILAANG